jgi:hypothetical protein
MDYATAPLIIWQHLRKNNVCIQKGYKEFLALKVREIAHFDH